MALSYGDTKQTVGSTGQLPLNLLGIILADTLTLLAQRFFWAKQRERSAEKAQA
ncbi:hypothetical protein GCM10010307_37400 [Streptomyces vastus]|uniref:ABC transporter permease n=1 Tax=Streptomyces vastus TaxID=285451 RepID=A0ABN3QZA3_9ACTN